MISCLLLAGPIPSELGELKALTYLNLGANALTGEWNFDDIRPCVACANHVVSLSRVDFDPMEEPKVAF